MKTKYGISWTKLAAALMIALFWAAGGTAFAQTATFEVHKLVSADTASPGDTLTYTIWATFPTTSRPWVQPVFDDIPATLRYISGSATGSVVFDARYNRLRWSLSGSGPADTAKVTFRAIIDAAQVDSGTVIANVAYVPGGIGVDDTARTVIMPKPYPPELTITKRVDSTLASPYSILAYQLTVRNVGKVAADSIVVIDTVPAYTVFVDASNGGRYNAAARTITWVTGPLDPGEVDYLGFRAAVEGTAPDSAIIPNVAFITAPDSTQSDTVITTVRPHIPPELEISKSVNRDSAFTGDTLAYTLVVTNVGQVPVELVRIADTLPAHLSFIYGAAGPNGSFDPDAGVITWTVPSLDPDASATVVFSAIIDTKTPDSTIITNIGSIIEPDTVISNAVTTFVKPHIVIPPELKITKVVSDDSAFAGDTLIYLLLLTNVGDVPVRMIRVADTLPAHLNYIDGSAIPSGSFDPDAGVITWFVSGINPGGMVPVSFTAVIDAKTPDSTIITNSGAIIDPDTVPSNPVTTFVRPHIVIPPELTITKLVDSSEASPKSVLTYTIRVSNVGETKAEAIAVADLIPEFTTYVPGSADMGGTYDGELNSVHWTIGILYPEQAATVSFRVTIDKDAPDSTLISNIARITTPDEVDSDPAVTIVRVPTGGEDLVIVKAVNTDLAAPRDTLTYTITITNTGDDTVDDIVVVDTLSNLITLVPGSISAGGVFNNGTRVVTWAISSLAGAATIQLSLRAVIDVNVPDETQIINGADISAPVPIPGNRVTTTVRRDVFELRKSVNRPIATNTDTLTYSIHYANIAGKTKRNVVIVDTLEPMLEYIPGSATAGGIYDDAGRTLTWHLETLREGDEGTLQFRTRISGAVHNLETIPNVALAWGDNLPLTVSPPVVVTIRFPEVELSKIVSAPQSTAGDTIFYGITIVNNGAGPVMNAVLLDVLPDGFTLIRGTVLVNGQQVAIDSNNPLEIPVGTVNVGARVTIVYNVFISPDAPATGRFINSAVLRGTNSSGSPVQFGPVHAEVTLTTPRLTITKTPGSPSGTLGSLIRYTIVVTNGADVSAHRVVVNDLMPDGLFYVAGSSLLNGRPTEDPTGRNPYVWLLGTIPAGGSATLQYTALVGADAAPGDAENTAWAEARISDETIRSPRVSAVVYVVGSTLTGTVRGRVFIDCNNDGVADSDTLPSGVDVYLDDGSQSRVNEMGMFYFSAVRAGERIVALDERDLGGFFLPSENAASVLVHVDEAGESYVTFAICPQRPNLIIAKTAAVVPIVKVTKSARLDAQHKTDTTGLMIDYEITIKSNGGVDPTRIRVVDSFPDETRLIIHENQTIMPTQSNNILTYDLMVDKPRLQQSVYYSLEDLAPGIRRFLTNKIHLEGDLPVAAETRTPIVSAPTEVSVGPFKRIPPKDIQLEVVGALFETSKAYLRPEAIPVLTTLADSMKEYDGAPVRVEGHADYRRIHTKEFPSNWELSTARAKSVVDWLILTGGIDSSRISYEGYAATRPRDTGRSPEALQRNRRVEVFLKGRQQGKVDVSGLTTDRWEASTRLELVPMLWDTTFLAPAGQLEAGLDDLWEVHITVQNTGPVAAEDALLIDVLPAGTILQPGSLRLNGIAEDRRVEKVGDSLILHLGRMEKGQTIDVRYRLTAATDVHPTGGGAAVVEVKTPDGGTHRQLSNTVRFR